MCIIGKVYFCFNLSTSERYRNLIAENFSLEGEIEQTLIIYFEGSNSEEIWLRY